MQVLTTTRRRTPALVAALLLLLTGIAAVLPLRTPDPRPASAPAGDFSAARAAARLETIAKVPHPTGSAAQADVRRYLVAELRKLGLTPGSRTRVAPARSEENPAVLGSVADVHAKIPGTEPTGRVLLVAHYDSVPTAPGATDDGAAVAAILEIARVLQAGPRPRDDVEFLLTDGEEPGLLGSQAFVDAEAAAHRGAGPGRTAVVNMEGRGSGGPAMMFQMAGTGLTPAVRASGALTTSPAAALYDTLPNDTDLTTFADAGMRASTSPSWKGPGTITPPTTTSPGSTARACRTWGTRHSARPVNSPVRASRRAAGTPPTSPCSARSCRTPPG
ncbi:MULTISPECIES: M20/M25/M40 family metallo-hydrolase [Streptomyces]|uniref:Vacuolar membrane protease n=1 Tax=Streptomyces ramulosus TaxID=47762 RepID=A0ABW1FDW1_9ACTN